MTKTSFSLKDHLFNKKKLEKIADEIAIVYPRFLKQEFVHASMSEFPKRELKQRITWTTNALKQFLPDNYQKAVHILIQSLPPPNDPTKEDNDFGDFIYAPYAEFIAKYGCDRKNLTFSLAALKEITQRFSAENAIRYFINAFPLETIAQLQIWSTDSNYHVRRLTSEGTRPRLPWSQKINIPIETALPVLDNLFFDKTRYVTRSVANHVNDISKVNPVLALTLLKKWQVSGKQNKQEMAYIIAHSLRTLIKQGNVQAFSFLEYSEKPQVKLTNLTFNKEQITIGDTLEFSFTLRALKKEKLLIDYILWFQSKLGQMTNKKVFKLTVRNLEKDTEITLCKKHPFRKNMTTRTIYPGAHKVAIQVNGTILAAKTFFVEKK